MNVSFSRNRLVSVWSIGLLVASLAGGAAAFEWETTTPESQGMSSEALDAIRTRLESKKTKAFLVVRNDKIVYEWYSADHGPTKPHGTASLAKAIVGGLSLAVAMTDGKIALDDPATKFVPQWKLEPQKSQIKIRHLGSHTSGIEDSSVPGISHPNEPGWKGEFWKRLDPPNDPFTLSRDKSQMLFAPGEKLQYSNPGIGMLTYCVTAAIQDGPHKDIRTLLRERVMRPIGVPDKEWSCGYGQTPVVEGLPLVGSWGGGNFTARAAATIGRLMLRQGDWDGKRILSQDAVRLTTGSAGLPGGCGMGWWTNALGRYAGVPHDAYWGAGAGDQLLMVVPRLNLIMVRSGQTLEPGPGEEPVRKDDVFTQFHDYRTRILFEPLVAAVKPATKADRSAAPYPASKVIGRVQWAPKETIVRQARGGDNWPITWADDGQLYTAYGDANGFEPFLPQKLSMGLARVEGEASNFRGTNLRSPTFETKGDGARGRKASGMLMVDGMLYVLARNTNNAQLGWSSDHGQTWTWSDWRFTTSFGCPTFLNFGPNYAGARDENVYVYSHDNDSAYEPADGTVLARVPKDRIRDQAAYEYFHGLDSAGSPVWTKAINKRGHVIRNLSGSYRTSVSYNAGLKRYLLCQIVADENRDTRFGGGFGIYEAPQPWGPWATVYYTDHWDVGPGETCSLPTKWMSSDGRTAHLVFSGDDCFSVRKVEFAVR